MGRNTEPYNSNIHDNLLIDLRIMVKGNLARMYCLYERSNSNSFLLNLMTTDSMMVRYYVSTIRNGISLLKNNRFFLARKHKRNFFVPLAPVKNSFFFVFQRQVSSIRVMGVVLGMLVVTLVS